MMNVIGKIGKGALHELIEQHFGALVMQHEQDKALIDQLQARVDTLTKQLEQLQKKNEP